ncbi:hypothetical protein A2U01_0040867, partial [Trifolium medium]|nr:hypothetical protein [Trifolium medium]
EEFSDAKATELKVELARLEGRKKEVHISVKEDVAKLLEKCHILLELESKQANLGGSLSRILEDLKMVKKCRRDIENMWTEAGEAANLF